MHTKRVFQTVAVVSLFSICNGQAANAASVTVNTGKQLNPSKPLIRGDILIGNKAAMAGKIDNLAANGFKAACFHFELNKENALFSGSGTNITHQQHAAFNANRKRAHNKGMTVFAQCSGTPDAFNIDTKYKYHGKANYYPLPVPGQFNLFANKVSAWMNNANAVAPSIWLGTQEPDHTLGYVNGVQTQAGNLTNIKRYADLWARVAKKLNGKSGAMQLNEASHISKGDTHPALAANSLNQHNSPINYYSVQNYKAEQNATVVPNAKKALNLLPTNKIMFNRYGYRKDWNSTTRFARSKGIVELLKAEKVLLNNSDKVVGYCLMHQGFSNYAMAGSVGKFLNEMPGNRRETIISGNGINAFATSNNNKLRIAVWNNGSTSQTVNIKVNGGAWKKASLNILRGNGSSVNTVNATYNANTGAISGFNLSGKAFALIRLSS